MHIAGLLDTAERLVEQNPDSALACLDSIMNPYELSKQQYNRYLLLQIQAKDKANRNITSDTLIFRVKNYYIAKKDNRNTALAYFYCGRVLQEQKKGEEAMSCYLTAETYANQADDTNLKGLIQSAVGSILFDQLLKDEAIYRFKRAVAYFQKIKNRKNEIGIYTLIGNCYLLKAKIDSASHYYTKGLALAETVKDSIRSAMINQNIGVLYREKGDYIQAKQSFKKAIPYAINETEQARIYLNIAKVFEKENQKDSALFYAHKVLALQGKTEENHLLANTYSLLSKIEESRANFQKALEYHKSYTRYLSSIIDENKNKAVLDIQKKYDFERIQNENNQLALQKERTLLFASAAFSICILIVFFFYLKSIHDKKKVAETEQKLHALMDMAENYREQERSIHNTLVRHFEILRKAALLESKIAEQDKKQSQKLIKEFNEIVYGQDSLDWDLLYQSMNELEHGFFDRLHAKYPQLDKSEFRICCLTYAQFSRMEIAVVLNLSTSTIQSKRATIRKKLGLDSFGNIQLYIDNELRKS